MRDGYFSARATAGINTQASGDTLESGPEVFHARAGEARRFPWGLAPQFEPDMIRTEP